MQTTSQEEALKILLHGYIIEQYPSTKERCRSSLSNIGVASKVWRIIGQDYTFDDISEFLDPEMLVEFTKKCIMDSCVSLGLSTIHHHHQPFELVKTTVPSLPPYYISRTLQLRRRLASEAIHSSSKDVFVFKNVSRSTLSLLAKGEPTEVSKNLTKRLTARFIVLEHDDDFLDICNISHTPVHLFSYEHGNYNHIKSFGASSPFPVILEHEQEEVLEEQFVCLVDALNMSAVSIADVPGMGKSTLLASIANARKKLVPNIITVFISISTLVNTHSSIGLETVDFEIIASYLTNDPFIKVLLIRVFSYHQTRLELYLDGLDEIFESQLDMLMHILAIFAKNQKIKVFIASRYHNKHIAEEIFGVCSVTLQPFNKENGKVFLTEYWIHAGASRNEFLQEYASICLLGMQSNFRDLTDFLSTPYNCMSIATYHEKDAIRFSRRKYSRGITPRLNSILNVYGKFLHRCKYQDTSSDNILTDDLFRAYIWCAIENKFPSSVHKYLKYVTPPKLDIKEMLRGGLVTQNHKSEIKFVNESFMDFLIAKWITIVILNPQVNHVIKHMDYFAEFLLGTVMSTQKNVYPKHLCEFLKGPKNIKLYRFSYPEICCFLNDLLYDMLEEGFSIDSLPKLVQTTAHQSNQKFFEGAMACALHDCKQMFWLVKAMMHSISSNMRTSSIPWLNIMYVASKFSSLSLLQELTHCINHNGNVMKSGVTLLNIACERGDYSIVEYFVNGNVGTSSKFLLHCLAYHSYENNADVIYQKLEIMKLLLSKNKQVLIEQYENIPPSLVQQVHPDILKSLFENNPALMSCTNNKGSNIAHLLADYCTPQLLHKMVLSPNFTGLFRKQNDQSFTPLQLCVLYITMLPETLKYLAVSGIDFDETDMDGENALFFAIRGGRNESTLSILVKYGCNYERGNKSERTPLHVATEYGNVSAIEYLISVGANVNAKDKEGDTPLHSAVQSRKNRNLEKTLKTILAHGGNLTEKNAVGFTPTELAQKRRINIELVDTLSYFKKPSSKNGRYLK